MWHHPKYYKELRKRNKSDQAISLRESETSTGERSPGPGLKQQAIDETVPHNDIEEASSSKQQASSKPEPVQVQTSSSAKRQASQSE